MVAQPRNETLWTVSRIADRLRVPRHRVEYVITTRGITPIASAGVARVYDETDVSRIAHELERINDERPNRAGGEL